jgi:hypothetical protein
MEEKKKKRGGGDTLKPCRSFLYWLTLERAQAERQKNVTSSRKRYISSRLECCGILKHFKFRTCRQL